jgi:hypothetical protein
VVDWRVPDEAEFVDLVQRFPRNPGTRSVIVVEAGGGGFGGSAVPRGSWNRPPNSAARCCASISATASSMSSPGWNTLSHRSIARCRLAVYPDPVQPYLPPPPPPSGHRRWIPAAIISAGIIIAGVVVGGAVLSNGNRAYSNATNTVVATEASSTCQAWKTTRTAIIAIPDLPAGWDWDTPGIDVYINNQANALEKAFALFEPQITTEPANVAVAARAYVEARRGEIAAKRNQTYGAADAVPVNMALGTLNQLCGITP